MKALLYVRVGNDNLDAINDKLRKCREKANELGFTDFAQYVDVGLSNQERPDFKKMIDEYRNGDIIVTSSPDRISRNMTQLLNFQNTHKVHYVDYENVPMIDALVEELAKHEQNHKR